MKTVVYQSYRTTNVPPWITRSMESVKSWAAMNGFEYRFIDDRFFDYVPQSYREKVKNHMLPITDLARLEVAREFLDAGFDQTIWVDADVIVFNQAKFNVETKEDFAFCREVWIRRLILFGITLPVTRCDHKVNNAVMVFKKSNSILDFYRNSCYALAENMPRKFDAGYVSTTFLTWLHQRRPLPLLTNIALLSPLIMNDLANGTDKYAQLFMKEFAYPVYAANLCHTMNSGTYMGVRTSNAVYDAAIDCLIESEGQILNQYLPVKVNS